MLNETYFSSDLLDAWDWLVRNRPEVKPVFSFVTVFTEYFATTYDLFAPVRSGEAPQSQWDRPDRRNEVDASVGGLPSLLTVAAMDARGTADRADDVIAAISARGPGPGGSRKPDVAAPAMNLWLAAGDSNEMALRSFNSAGPANVIGAAALLRQAGVRRSLELKALLINSTTGTRWDPAWGWGAVDVGRAHAQRQGVVSGTVAPRLPGVLPRLGRRRLLDNVGLEPPGPAGRPGARSLAGLLSEPGSARLPGGEWLFAGGFNQRHRCCGAGLGQLLWAGAAQGDPCGQSLPRLGIVCAGDFAGQAGAVEWGVA